MVTRKDSRGVIMLLFSSFCYSDKAKFSLFLSLATDVVSFPEDKRLHLPGLADLGRAFKPGASFRRARQHGALLPHRAGFIGGMCDFGSL